MSTNLARGAGKCRGLHSPIRHAPLPQLISFGRICASVKRHWDLHRAEVSEPLPALSLRHHGERVLLPGRAPSPGPGYPRPRLRRRTVHGISAASHLPEQGSLRDPEVTLTVVKVPAQSGRGIPAAITYYTSSRRIPRPTAAAALRRVPRATASLAGSRRWSIAARLVCIRRCPALAKCFCNRRIRAAGPVLLSGRNAQKAILRMVLPSVCFTALCQTVRIAGSAFTNVWAWFRARSGRFFGL